MPRGRHAWARLGKASGAAIGKIAVKTYVCRGCGLQHFAETLPGRKMQKPTQCRSCGRMDFDYFDSKGEAHRWADLLNRQRAGLIAELARQVRFPLLAWNAELGQPAKVGEFIADFTYRRVDTGRRVIEDYKGGAVSPEASLKLRWMTGMGLPVDIATSKGVTNG